MNHKTLITTGAALAAALALSPATAALNPFAATPLAAGYQLADGGAMPPRTAAEAKCGADQAKATQEAKCGAGNEQARPKQLNEAKCGEAKCGANKRRL